MTLTPSTFDYGLPTEASAWNTMRCFAPLMNRQQLAELVAAFVQGVRDSPRPTSERGLEGAVLTQGWSLAATDDDRAIGYANMALEYCCEAYSEMVENPSKEAYQIKRNEALAQEALIRQLFASHPDYATYAPRYAEAVTL